MANASDQESMGFSFQGTTGISKSCTKESDPSSHIVVSEKLDDVKVSSIQPLLPPGYLTETLPVTPSMADFISQSRCDVKRVLASEDDRLIVLVGPDCIHHRNGALAFATMLAGLRDELKDDLLIVMQVDFETPRKSHSASWKGLINEPGIDGKTNINKGLEVCRDVMIGITKLNIPIATEYLDPIIPQFVADLVTTCVFSGRISESQVHRELASGLSSPVGFCNGTNGSIQQAVDACNAATRPHSFLSVTKQGLVAIVYTAGNPGYFVMLSGSEAGPVHSKAHVADVKKRMTAAGLKTKVGIDCAHQRSGDVSKQQQVAQEVADMISEGEEDLAVILLESWITGGVQTLAPGGKPTVSESVTEPCLDWATTEKLLRTLAKAVQTRRAKNSDPPAKKQKK